VSDEPQGGGVTKGFINLKGDQVAGRNKGYMKVLKEAGAGNRKLTQK